MRFEIYVKDNDVDVINKLKEKGRSTYIVGLVKDDLNGGRITRSEVIQMINSISLNCTSNNKITNNDLEDSISSVFDI
jgi:hypothetical protein